MDRVVSMTRTSSLTSEIFYISSTYLLTWYISPRHSTTSKVRLEEVAQEEVVALSFNFLGLED